jgi:hypothetical protein
MFCSKSHAPQFERSGYLDCPELCWMFCSCGSSAPAASTPPAPATQSFSGSFGQIDVMPYFAMSKQSRDVQFMNGQQNPIYTEDFPTMTLLPAAIGFG